MADGTPRPQGSAAPDRQARVVDGVERRLAGALADQARPLVQEALHMAIAQQNSAPAGARRSDRRIATVAAIERPADGVALLQLHLDPGTVYPFTAGQFCMVHATPLGPDERPYSIASPPSALPRLDLAVKDVNELGESGWLYHCGPGDQVEIGAALGAFTFKTPPGRTAVFLATGTGVAPFRSILRDQWDHGLEPEVWLFLGAPIPDGLPYHDELAGQAVAHPAFHYVPVVSRAPPGTWTGATGHVQDAFQAAFATRTDIDAYLCGVPVMVVDAVQLLRAQGVPSGQIHQERFTSGK